MSRFHVNPSTGEIGQCRATKSCPFGDLETDHYPSVVEAQAGYEASMRNATVPLAKRSEPDLLVPLSAVMPLDVLERDVAEGFIAAQSHPNDDSLKVMCYTKQTQFAGRWTDATKVARGLIVRSEQPDFSDAVVIERPWKKFFTLEQLESGWHLGDEEGGSAGDDELARLDFSARAEVSDKADGSMGVLYRHPDGRLAFATKGSFASDQALYYTRMLRSGKLEEEAEGLVGRGDKTFLFEMVGRNNRIVLDYPEDQLILLGAVEKRQGFYLSANDYADRWSGGIVETMPARTVSEALALPDRPQREGVVIRVLSDDPTKQMQLKVKQDDYKMLHRAVTGFSVSDMRASLRESPDSMADLMEVARTGDVSKIKGVASQLELLEAHPLLSDVKEERKASYEKVLLPRLEKLSAAHARVSSLPKEFFEQENPSKVFAAEVKEEKDLIAGDLYTFFQARLRGQSLDSMGGGKILGGIAREIKNDSLRTFEE